MNRLKTTVVTAAKAEPLSPLPAPFPAELRVTRTVSAQALVGYDGNFYSVGPGHRDQEVTVVRVLGAGTIDIVSAAGNTLARHRLEPIGAHAVVRLGEHVAALEKAVLAASGDQRAPCRRKQSIPPSVQARAEAERVRARLAGQPLPTDIATGAVIDFATYAAASRPLTVDNTADATDELVDGGWAAGED